jgi:hypothetical protein
MMARAISERWPISEEKRLAMLDSLMQIASDVSNSPRERTSAIRALISADSVNLRAQEIEQNNEHHQQRIQQQQLARLAEVARELGFNTLAEQATEGRPAIDFIRDDASEHNQDNRT